MNSVISIIGVSTCLGDVLYRDLLTKAAIATASFRPRLRVRAPTAARQINITKFVHIQYNTPVIEVNSFSCLEWKLN